MTEQTATPAAQPEPMVPKPKVPAMVLEHLKAAVRRITPDHKDFCGSDEVRVALEDDNLRIYLDTWVRPLLANVVAWAEGAEGAAAAGNAMNYAHRKGHNLH